MLDLPSIPPSKSPRPMRALLPVCCCDCLTGCLLFILHHLLHSPRESQKTTQSSFVWFGLLCCLFSPSTRGCFSSLSNGKSWSPAGGKKKGQTHSFFPFVLCVQRSKISNGLHPRVAWSSASGRGHRRASFLTVEAEEREVSDAAVGRCEGAFFFCACSPFEEAKVDCSRLLMKYWNSPFLPLFLYILIPNQSLSGPSSWPHSTERSPAVFCDFVLQEMNLWLPSGLTLMDFLFESRWLPVYSPAAELLSQMYQKWSSYHVCVALWSQIWELKAEWNVSSFYLKTPAAETLDTGTWLWIPLPQSRPPFFPLQCCRSWRWGSLKEGACVVDIFPLISFSPGFKFCCFFSPLLFIEFCYHFVLIVAPGFLLALFCLFFLALLVMIFCLFIQKEKKCVV